jgi:hypothetical protein
MVRVYTLSLCDAKEQVGLTPSDSAADYLQGNVKVDEYVTHSYKLAGINDGFDAMHVNGCLFVSGSCLTVLSRTAIASVLLSTCHKFQREGSERNLVNCVCIVNVVAWAVSESSCTCSVIAAKQAAWQIIRAFFQMAPNGGFLVFQDEHPCCSRNGSEVTIEVPATSP